jgi:hypothetical protein
MIQALVHHKSSQFHPVENVFYSMGDSRYGLAHCGYALALDNL